MDKTPQPPPADTTANPSAQTPSAAANSNSSSNSASIYNNLRQLNKSSYKISKPASRQSGEGSSGTVSSASDVCDSSNPGGGKPQTPPLSAASSSQQPLPQPPVYNINKNDFREVVQKLTGSPAHQPGSPSPPVVPKPIAVPAGGGVTSSRLQRIRPPPLPELALRPPPPVALPAASSWRTPLSPLPPLPTVSAAAESPISAYMRCLRSGSVPSPGAPPSPLSFGCIPSPRSAYQMMMSPPGFLHPSSPRLPMPSPRRKEQ